MISKKKEFSFNVTDHGFISGIYFNYIIKNIKKCLIKNKKIKVLDFGCGHGHFKRKLGNQDNIKVINYDIIKEYSDIKNWRNIKFDYLVATHVFMYFRKKELETLLSSLKKHNPNLKMIIVISKQGFLNNLGKFILNEPDAHKGTLLNHKEEIKILRNFTIIKFRKNLMFLSDLFSLEFK